MPVFRNDPVTSKERVARLGRLSNSTAKIRDGNRFRLTRKPALPWGLRKAPFKEINTFFHGQLSKEIADFLKNHPGKKMFVLDWGCYDGLAADQLGAVSGLKVFGFTRDAHPDLLGVKNATILNTEKEHLVRYLRRHKIKFDLVYSRMGLTYLQPEEFVSHLTDLKEQINIGGKVFTGVSTLGSLTDVVAALERVGYSPVYEGKVILYFVRKS